MTVHTGIIKGDMQLVRVRDKGLRQLHKDGNARGVPSAIADKLRKLLFTLETAETLEAAQSVSRLEAASA
jgi:plasmid maintenance system killer protein